MLKNPREEINLTLKIGRAGFRRERQSSRWPENLGFSFFIVLLCEVLKQNAIFPENLLYLKSEVKD